MSGVFNDLWREHRGLILATGGFLAATTVLASLIPFDSTQILGINRWIKPIKFSSSASEFIQKRFRSQISLRSRTAGFRFGTRDRRTTEFFLEPVGPPPGGAIEQGVNL